jgi:hypothetical protein
LCLVWLCAAPAWGALSVERIALHQFEDGPLLGPAHVFLPGESIFFSCRLTGYQTAVSGDEQHSVKLSWRVQISDPSGTPLAPDAAGRIAEPVFSQDKNWIPKFAHSFVVPPFAPGGTYHIKVQAKDEVAGSEIDSGLDFQVRGHPVEPSTTLVGRNLHFLHSEADGPPLDPVIYHPGEMLWARFDITGYQHGDKNRYSVEYGLAILRESGEQVFAQPGAAADTNESFYPQRYVPGALSLSLAPEVPEGTYTLLVTIADKVGNQTAETRGTFRIQK